MSRLRKSDSLMDSLQFVPVLVVGFAASLGMTPLSRALALRFGVVDKPQLRKLHQKTTPLMGGLAILVGFALALLLFGVPDGGVELVALLVGALLMGVVGLIDDRFVLGIRAKFIAQAIAALILIAAGVHIRLVGFAPIDYLLTIVWVAGITNAVNFLDNMDGLAAGLSAIAASFFTWIAYNEGLVVVSVLSAALAGSAFGFLIYNFNPASSFMGDMGSLVLGFVLASLAIMLEFGSQPLNVTWMVPVLILGLPVFDIFLVVITRIFEGRSPGEAGKDHTSHRLISLGLSQRWTLVVLYSACILLGTLGALVSVLPSGQALVIGGISFLGLAAAFVAMMIVRQRIQLGGSRKVT